MSRERNVKVNIISVGAGTAGCGMRRSVTRSAPARDAVGGVSTIDKDRIAEHNIPYCTEYAGHTGEPKSLENAALWREALPQRVPVDGIHGSFEDVDMHAIIAEATRLGMCCVVHSALDDWNSRSAVVQDTRDAAARVDGARVAIVQTGLDRGRAVVDCFDGRDFEATCNICGLSLPLPMVAPCHVATPGGSLRGDLRAESEAAGDVFVEILLDFAAGRGDRWMSTKTHLHRDGAGGGFRRMKVSRARADDCMGAHTPCGPMSFEALTA